MAPSTSSSSLFSHRLKGYLPTPTRIVRNHRAEHPIVTLPQLDQYHNRAESALTETISAYGKLEKDVDTLQWMSLRSKRGVRLFRGHHDNGRTPLLCVGTLHARFDEVLESLYCDNTEEMLLTNAIKCPRLTKSAMLYVLQKKTALDPYAFTGIKCATVKLPIGSNRDLCYFDKLGMVHQPSGKRMAYHIMQSVDLPDYPHKTMHKRLQVSLCYVFEELENDLVGVYMRGELNDETLSYFTARPVSDVLLSFVNALACTRAKKFALQMSATRIGVWKSTTSRKSCNICKGFPSFFEKLTECAGCNKPVCKKCRFKECILARSTLSSDQPKHIDFCHECISKVNLLSINQLRVEARGETVVQLATVVLHTTLEKMDEDVEVNIEGSEQSLMSFVQNISAQVHVLSSHRELRASNLSSMGWDSSSDEESETPDNESEDRDVLNSSRLKSGPIEPFDKIQVSVSRRSRCSTTSTASPCGHEEDDLEQYQSLLMAKLQQVSNLAEETLLFAREQSVVAHSVRERSRSRRLLQQ